MNWKSIAILAPSTCLLMSCSYFEQRKDDLLDIVYISGGRAAGLSADIFISPIDLPLGIYGANVYGWEGREFIHRSEEGAGLGIGFVEQDKLNDWTDSGPKFQIIRYVPRETNPAEDLENPTPFVYSSFLGFSASRDEYEPSELDAINPAQTGQEYPVASSWGAGIGLTPGLATVRMGVRPFGIVNFATGILGFHLFAPYKPFSNSLDFDSMSQRGVLMPGDRESCFHQLILDLEHDDPFVVLYSIRMLGNFSEHRDDVEKALKPYLDSQKSYYRLAAIIALGQIDPENHPTAPRLKEFLKSYEGGWRGQIEKLISSLEGNSGNSN